MDQPLPNRRNFLNLAAAGWLSPSGRSAGWRALFDGKSFTGWDDPARKKPPGDSWTIEDGCLKALDGRRIWEDLATLDTFQDFEMTFEWKMGPGANSGVKYRVQALVFLDVSKMKPGQSWEEAFNYEVEHKLSDRAKLAPGARGNLAAVGFEYQLIDEERHPDARHGMDRRSGALYGLVAPSRLAARPVGEFNESRIVLSGNRVEHWLNGERVVEARLDSPEVLAGLAKRWGAASPVFKLLGGQPRKKCPIVLQNHNGEAWFRNIRLRD
jgi:hypothetical protein